jgi:dimethylargininase
MQGLATAKLGVPDYNKAIKQHQSYINALADCGLEIIILEADENYPDSTFIEDTALLTPRCAIIMNPGAPSRRGEIIEIKKVLSQFYSNIEQIYAPGTAEAGDIMMVANHFFIGLSERTNADGANQVIKILNYYNMSGSTIKLQKVLHLKTGAAYLENNCLAVTGEFTACSDFDNFIKIEIPEEESYAANCIWVNDKVIIPAEYPVTKQKMEKRGYSVIETDVSEFQKVDGGISCLSLRF